MIELTGRTYSAPWTMEDHIAWASVCDRVVPALEPWLVRRSIALDKADADDMLSRIKDPETA